MTHNFELNQPIQLKLFTVYQAHMCACYIFTWVWAGLDGSKIFWKKCIIFMILWNSCFWANFDLFNIVFRFSLNWVLAWTCGGTVHKLVVSAIHWSVQLARSIHQIREKIDFEFESIFERVRENSVQKHVSNIKSSLFSNRHNCFIHTPINCQGVQMRDIFTQAASPGRRTRVQNMTK